jgi:hypothetical protein
MKIDFFQGEAMFLTFKLADGSGYLTSHRLILTKHEPGEFDTAVPRFYLLKNFKKSQIKGDTLTAHFEGNGKAKIKLCLNSPSLLQEVKEYIEKASENHITEKR